MLSADNESHPHIVEQATRLSRSLIWRLQRNYYEQQGVDAWRLARVPQYITSNPFIAETYVRLVVAYLEDRGLARVAVNPASTRNTSPIGSPERSPDAAPETTIDIVELGAGSGRFAHAFLTRLRAARRHFTFPRVRYVMTDLAERNVTHWREHSSLGPLVEEGILDFARFDPGSDHRIDLVVSGQTLTTDVHHSALIIIANYFFDGIRHDAFEMKDGQLREGKVTITSPQEEPDPNDPEIIERMALEFQYEPISIEGYYEDPAFNAILREYPRRLPSSIFTFPVGPLECCRNLQTLGAGRILLLAGDRGYAREDALIDREGLGFARHGSFSVEVNFDAIAQFFKGNGGSALLPPHDAESLLVGAFAAGDTAAKLPRLHQRFSEDVVGFGPDDFFPLKVLIQDQSEKLTMEEALAWVRLGRDDPELLRLSVPVLLQYADSATATQKRQIRDAVERAWELYFPLGERADVAGSFGVLLYAFDQPTEALSFFNKSIAAYGPSAEVCTAIARCYLQLGDLQAARDHLEEAIELDPDDPDARALQQDLQG